MSRDLARSGSRVRQLGVSARPHPPGLLPVPGRSSECGPEQARSYAMRAEAGERHVSRLLIPAADRRSVACPAICCAAAVTPDASVRQKDRVCRVYCRCPADRGTRWDATPDAPTPSAEAGERRVSRLLILAIGRRSVACPAIWREAAVESGNSVGQRDRISRVCCRCPADRPSAAQSKRAPTPSAEAGEQNVSRLLILAIGRRSVACPAIWREAAVKSGNSVCQRDRIRRVCCRCPADRGTRWDATPDAPTPSAEAGERRVSRLLILPAGRRSDRR